MLTRLKKKINQILLRTKDIHAAEILHQLTAQGKYFPTTGSSINFHSLATVINDLIINRRQSVIEFGSGLSTVYLARAIRDFGLSATVVSVDDNAEWIKLLQQILEAEGLADFIRFADAPLCPNPIGKNGLHWYNEPAIKSAAQDVKPYDLVLVDGPMAYDAPRALSRFPAASFVKPNLASEYSIFLDDVHRTGEQQIAKWWESELNAEIKKVNSQFWLLGKGESFNPIV